MTTQPTINKEIKMIKVYHTTNWAINSNLHFADKGTYKPVKSNYKLVAEVVGNDLGVAFQKTNHIDTAWWENDGVYKVEESRSTSVGDLMEMEDGTLIMVAGIGFDDVEWDETDEFIVVKDQYGDYKMSKSEFTPSQWKAYNELADEAVQIRSIRKLGKKIFVEAVQVGYTANYILGPKGKVESELIEE
jgi:hypothetical protein